jgi:hypothetical protein
MTSVTNDSEAEGKVFRSQSRSLDSNSEIARLRVGETPCIEMGRGRHYKSGMTSKEKRGVILALRKA